MIRAAGPEDVPLLMGLIVELAEYERLADAGEGDRRAAEGALFGERPAAEALIAELDGEPAGYALFFPTFSTFLAIQGVWLEDLFVRPSCRRKVSAGRCWRRWRPAPVTVEGSGSNGRPWTGTSWRSTSTGASARPGWTNGSPTGWWGRSSRGWPAGGVPRQNVGPASPRHGVSPRSPMDKTTAS